MVAVAVKVKDPEHVGLLPAVMAILMVGTTVVFTVMVMPDEVIVAGVAHVAFDVMVQVITSPLTIPLLVYVEAV